MPILEFFEDEACTAPINPEKVYDSFYTRVNVNYARIGMYKLFEGEISGHYLQARIFCDVEDGLESSVGVYVASPGRVEYWGKLAAVVTQGAVYHMTHTDEWQDASIGTTSIGVVRDFKMAALTESVTFVSSNSVFRGAAAICVKDAAGRSLILQSDEGYGPGGYGHCAWSTENEMYAVNFLPSPVTVENVSELDLGDDGDNLVISAVAKAVVRRWFFNPTGDTETELCCEIVASDTNEVFELHEFAAGNIANGDSSPVYMPS